MNLPTSNIRGFFEILMPGIFLLINIFITLYLLIIFVIPEAEKTNILLLGILKSPSLVLAILLVFGYPLGFVLRLLKNQKIDKRSAWYIGFLKRKEKGASYLDDHYFYNNWMHDKSIKRLPKAAADFYLKYWFDKYGKDGTGSTTFINFCKTIISKFDQYAYNEVYAAEALLRFVSGSYYAIQFSLLLMALNIFILYSLFGLNTIYISGSVFFGYLFLFHIILSQYRFLRCKEVDTVFNACFANREHFEALLKEGINRQPSKEANSNIRKRMLIKLWKMREGEDIKSESLRLDELIARMRKEAVKNSMLSSLYFAGSEVDHPYFLENDKIAVGLSVLPQDEEKAGKHRKHPHQTEYIIVLEGTIDICLDDETITLSKGEHETFEIPKNTCHWIAMGKQSKEAAYLFIKTNPSLQPRSQDC